MLYNSGFKRSLCGSSWESITGGNKNAFDQMGTSTGRIGCCPIGSFMARPFLYDLPSFIAENSCRECPSDFPKTVAFNADTSCNEKCPKGMYYRGVDRGCDFCPPGMFNDQEGSLGLNSCQNCSVGKYSMNQGSPICQACQGGKANTAEASASIDECQPCGTGEYSDAGAACQTCPAGKVQIASKTSCNDCPSGKFENQSHPRTTCDNCPNNTYTDQKEQIVCKVCHAAAYAFEGDTVCLRCEAGQYMAGAFTPERACTACTAGQVSAYGKTECKACRKGQYTMKLCDSCPAECEACPAGSYGKDVDIDLRTSESGACEKCDVGKYSAAEGASGCNKCPPGTASNVEGTRTIVVGFFIVVFHF